MSTLAYVRELIRRDLTDDDKFVQKLLYFFELKLPESVTAHTYGKSSFIFPLVLNPKSITLSEPFALESTLTQGGGLYVEEHGILQRTLTLQGTTGFKPRKMFRQPIQLQALKPDQKSFSRNLDGWVFDALSGQKHFQYLQDAVFRTYADLKRDPATAEGTSLRFHNPKDSEAWLVAPRSFVMERNASSPTSYNYNIELLILGPATLESEKFSEDIGLLNSIKNGIMQVRNAVALVTGAVNDLTALVDELEGVVKGIAAAIDDVSNVIQAASDFMNGVADLIAAPYAIINSLQHVFDTGVAFLESVDNFPDNVRQKIRQLSDGLDVLGAHPELFETSTDVEVKKFRRRNELKLVTSQAARDEALAKAPPGKVEDFNKLGSAMTPGDVTAADGAVTDGREQPAYTGAQEIEVGAGDTLVSLAARYLGDARLWQNIAILNGLKPPFTNPQAGANLTSLAESPLPGALGVGRKILLPNFSKPPDKQILLPILGVRREASAEEHLLGADLALVATTGSSGRTTYDIAIDVDGGSVDAKLVRGIPNLAQALRTRMATEQGSDILYRNLGMAPVVALNLRGIDIELAKFRILESLKADPRVSAVRKLNFQISEASPDAVEVEADVEVRGFTQTNNIKTVLRA